MEKVEPTLEGNHGEHEEELELDSNNSESEEVDEELDDQGGDRLDKIEDIEVMRAEAKKYRGISQRKSRPKTVEKENTVIPEKKEAPVQAQNTTDFLTKTDFYKSNERKAIRLATVSTEDDSEEIKQFKSDVLENWNDIVGLYTPRKGKETPEDIFEDIKDAYLLYRVKNPKEVKDDSALELTTTPVIKAGKVFKQKEVTTKEDNRYSLPKKPDSWYPKKQ